MKRLIATVLAITIVFSMLLSGCSNNNSSVPSDNANSNVYESVPPSESGNGPTPTPKPVEGVNYIGVRVETEHNGGTTAMDLYMICNNELITNCGTSEYTPGFRKDEFIGKPYWDGIRDFIGLIKADPNLNVVGLGAMIAGEEDYESYRERFDEGKNEHYRQINVEGAARETVEKFIEMCRISDEKYNGEWKALVDGEGGGPGGNGGQGEDYQSGKPAKNLEEVIEQKKAGVDHIRLDGDITIDVSKDDLFGVSLNCENHKVTFKGKLNGNDAVKKAGGKRLFELENASFVDLTGLTVTVSTFNKNNFVKESVQIVTIENTSKKKVGLPKYLSKKQDTRDMSPTSDRIDCFFTSHGDRFELAYRGPETTYAERNKLETSIVKAILTKGKSSIKDDSGHVIDCRIYTKVTVNVGKVKIPKVDPQEIRIMKGGKLTVKGTIAVTGGRLEFTIDGGSCLDIRGLKLTKKHPSPDMVKIRFGNKKVKPNMSLLKPKATSGSLKVKKGTESVDITIW